ncbi:hypothetical protein ACFE04_014923 [Oxalis oulophora]
MIRPIDATAKTATDAKPVKFLTKLEREPLQQQGLDHLRYERERERALRERHHQKREREDDAKACDDKLVKIEKEMELEAINEQYLGFEKPKKRVIKPSEKFRFSFDWENTEDTSRDMNSLYQSPHEAQVLFGRGFGAGMDRREQKTLAEKDGVDLHGHFDMPLYKHWSQKELDEMTEQDWRIFREDFDISYKGSKKIPRPMRNWAESGLTPKLMKAVEKVGYQKPSPIQMAAIPLGLQRRDVIGIAETGSGKTAAFVLPMLTYISRLPPMSEENEAEGPYAVVMAPTRELAQQIEEETMKFAKFLDIRVVSIVGGQSIEEQGFKIRQGCEVVIATPGRLIDCLERRYAVLNQCNYVVLDEADRMIDMGFEPQVMGVLDAMPSSNLKPENEDEELEEKRIYRTTYMFSATMPPAVERLARKYLRNPVVVTIGTAGKATDLITQHVIMVKESEKLSRLQRLLDEMGDKITIVFVNTRKTADMVSRNLMYPMRRYHVTTLHGGKSQDKRENILLGFRLGVLNVLVATDVADRGIDIPDVAHVINYDMPRSIKIYTHRIGRTGRAGKIGVASTFLTLHDSDVCNDLKQMLIRNSHAALGKAGLEFTDSVVYDPWLRGTAPTDFVSDAKRKISVIHQEALVADVLHNNSWDLPFPVTESIALVWRKAREIVLLVWDLIVLCKMNISSSHNTFCVKDTLHHCRAAHSCRLQQTLMFKSFLAMHPKKLTVPTPRNVASKFILTKLGQGGIHFVDLSWLLKTFPAELE